MKEININSFNEYQLYICNKAHVCKTICDKAKSEWLDDLRCDHHKPHLVNSNSEFSNSEFNCCTMQMPCPNFRNIGDTLCIPCNDGSQFQLF